MPAYNPRLPVSPLEAYAGLAMQYMQRIMPWVSRAGDLKVDSEGITSNG